MSYKELDLEDLYLQMQYHLLMSLYQDFREAFSLIFMKFSIRKNSLLGIISFQPAQH